MALGQYGNIQDLKHKFQNAVASGNIALQGSVIQILLKLA
jgi:hypothetical protein